MGGTSPIVPRAPVPTYGRPLAFPFSKAKAPSTVGRSRDDGRLGERRAAASVELDRASGPTPFFDRLGGWNSPPWLFLLKERQSDPTFESSPDLLFSLVKVPNPNRLRRDVFELIEPAAVRRPLESREPKFGVLTPGVWGGKSESTSCTKRSINDIKS